MSACRFPIAGRVCRVMFVVFAVLLTFSLLFAPAAAARPAPRQSQQIREAFMGSQPSYQVTREFDVLNRLAKTVDGEGRVTLYSYDNVGNLTALEDGLGRVWRYEYDSLNRLVRIEDPLNGPAHPTLFEYDGRDHVTRITAVWRAVKNATGLSLRSGRFDIAETDAGVSVAPLTERYGTGASQLFFEALACASQA